MQDRYLSALSHPDLLIAATAEKNRRTIPHYDGDFDMIASLTGQPAPARSPPRKPDTAFQIAPESDARILASFSGAMPCSAHRGHPAPPVTVRQAVNRTGRT